MSIEEYFETGPDFERPIFERVLTHLQELDPEVWFEPVSVGVFFKRRSRFLSLRTMTKWVAVCFDLDRRLTSARISRKVIQHGGSFHHVVNVRTVGEIDEELLDWLSEAWELNA